MIQTILMIALLNSVINPWLMCWYLFKNYFRKPTRENYYFCLPISNKCLPRPKNHIKHLNRETSRSDSLKQINYKLNLKTLDSASNYEPNFLVRFLSCFTNICHFNKKANYNIEANTAPDSTVRTVRAVLNDEFSVCSCQLNSSSLNRPSFSSSSSNLKNSGEFNRINRSMNRKHNICQCRAHHANTKVRKNDKNKKYFGHSSLSGTFHSGTENMASTLSETSKTNSTESKSSITTIAATAVYFVCCIKNRSDHSVKSKHRIRKKKILTRKFCIKYNKSGCMNNTYKDSAQYSYGHSSEQNNSFSLDKMQSKNQFEPRQFQLELLAHQENCVFKEKVHSNNKFNMKPNGKDFSLIGKANDLFMTNGNGVNIGLGNFNGKIKRTSNHNNFHQTNELNLNDNFYLKKNFINEKYNIEENNPIILIDSDKKDESKLITDKELNNLNGFKSTRKLDINGEIKKENSFIDKKSDNSNVMGEVELNI